MKIRNLVIGAVGLMSLGAFGCGAQGGTGPETTGTNASKITLGAVSISGTTPALRSHAAWCRIANNKLLVLGGYTTYGSTVTDRVELWEAKGAEVEVTVLSNGLNTARAEAKAISVGSNKCLIVGGKDGSGNAISVVEVYDGSSAGSTTVAIPDTGYTPVGRYGMTVSRYGSASKFLVVGGSDGSNRLASTEIIDLTTTTPTKLAGPSLALVGGARAYHAAANLDDDHILISGGLGETDVIADMTLIQSNGDVFSLAPMNQPRYHHAMVKLGTTASGISINGTDYQFAVVGGSNDANDPGAGVLASGEVYTNTNYSGTTSGSWSNSTSDIGNLTTARYDHELVPTNASATAFTAIGGRDSSNHALGTLQDWNGSGAWASQKNMPAAGAAEPRFGLVAEFMPGVTFGGPAVVVGLGYDDVASTLRNTIFDNN